MAYDGSLIFDTKIDNKGFQKGVTGLKSIASGSLKVVNKLMKTTAVAVAGIGTASIKVGAEFEAGMSNVAATMGITVDEINKGDKSFQMLEKAALEMGKTTQFSASDAAEALNYLALAGYDAEKATAALPKVLNLAAAGGLELGYASDLVTDSMSALGLETKDLDMFVDQLAKTSQKSNTNVSQLGEAILTVGGTAKIMKGGTIELNTQLGILADNGIKGAEGGTALRNVLLALSAPTKKQAEAMKGLGVETYDANGELRSTDDIFQDLNGVLGEMTEQERTEVLSKLFNKVDLKAANALLANSGERFAELSESIEKSEGAAEEMAATLNDNLKGKIELLKSAMEYLGIVIYKSVDSPLVGVIETLTEYVDKISSVLTAHDDARTSMEELGYSANQIEQELKNIPNGFKGAAIMIGEILAEIIVSFAEAAPQMLEMGVLLITSLLDGIRESLPQIGEAAMEIIQGFAIAYMEILPEVMVLGLELITMLVQGIAESMPELIPVALDMINTIIDSIVLNLPLILNSGLEILLALVDGIIQALPSLIKAGSEIIVTLVEFIVKNLPTIIKVGLDIIKALVDGILDNLPTLIKAAPELIQTLVEGLIKDLPKIIETGLELIKALVDGLINNIDLLVDAALQIVDSLTDFIVNNIDLVIDAALQIIMGLVSGLVNNINLLVDAAIKLVIGISGGIIQTIPQIVAAGIQVVVGLVSGLLQSIPQLVAAGIQLVIGLIGAILGMIPQVISSGLQLAGELVGGILQALGLIFEAGITLVNTFVEGVKSIGSSVVEAGKNIVRGLWDGISSLGGWLSDKISGFAKGVSNTLTTFFQIRSPSRLMAKYGKNIVEGLALGIKENKSKAEQAMYDMAQSIVKEYDRLGDAVMTALKNRYAEEERLQMDSLRKQVREAQAASDQQIRALDAVYAAKLRHLQFELSQEEGYIQSQIDAINNKTKAENEALEEERYRKTVSDKKKQILQEKDNEKRLELQEQLDEIIADRQRQMVLKQRDIQIEALREEMQKVRNQGEEKKKALELEHQQKIETERKKLESTIQYYEDEMTATQNHYEHLLTEERLQAEARRLILEENNDELIELLDSYNPLWQNAGQSFGESLLTGLNSMKQSIKNEVADILSLVGKVDKAYARDQHNKSESAYNDRREEEVKNNNDPNQAIRDHNIRLAQDKYNAAKERGDTQTMKDMHDLAERERAKSNQAMSNMARTMSLSSNSVINNDKGVTQNVTIVSPENTPSENARQMKKVGRELALGY